MSMPEPLVIRRSLTNWNFVFQTGFALASLGYAYALFAQWPSVIGRNVAADYLLGGVLVAGGGSLLVFLTLRAVFDRAPLLQIDSAGIRSREIGNLPVPWHEVSACYFEQVSEGRSYYWYFFFTQTDAATGLKFNYKISADEFDRDNEEVLALIEAFKSSDRSQPRAKPRPSTIITDLTGDIFEVRYSTAKELKAIGIYILIALAAVTIAAYIGITLNPKFFSFWQFVYEPWETLQLAEWWFHYVAIIALVLVVFGSLFRIRDMLFRKVVLRADRQGLNAADLSDETIAWGKISGISFEPYEKIKVIDMSHGYPADLFAALGHAPLNSQEIYGALCWLLRLYKVKFSQPWEAAPTPEG